jgi:rRNA-processing protein FCF1
VYVIIDTSSIVFGLSNRKDVFETASNTLPRTKPLISKGIINELTKISKNRGRKGASARVALQLIHSRGIRVERSEAGADIWILTFSKIHRDTVVITNDSTLARRLKSIGVQTLKVTKSGLLK